MPIYEWQCRCGALKDVLADIDDRNKPVSCECGADMARMITEPTIHTIDTHLRGTRLSQGDGYYDSNLRDPKTGKVPYVTSLAMKKKLLRERGLFEYGNDLPAAQTRQEKERLSKRVSIAGSST